MAEILFDAGETVEYVPSRFREDKVPVVVGLRYLTFAASQRYDRAIAQAMKFRNGPPDMAKVAENTSAVEKRRFVENVAWVKNLTVKGRKIETAEDLYDIADGKLMIELLEAMKDAAMLTEGQLKNFAPQSGTGSAAPSAS